jgi:hypothetical protein
MKNKTLYFLLFVLLGLVACKKSYTCNCTTTTAAKDPKYPSVITNVSETKSYSEKMNEKQAKSACSHQAETIKSTYDNSFTENGTRANFADVSVVCEIK